MKWIIAGLGNPGGEYASTRHNAGRIVTEALHASIGGTDWSFKKTYNARVAEGEISGSPTLFVEPETYMNESGWTIAKLVKSKSQASRLVVIYDDIDLPLGSWKFSFDRSSGGHNGVESIATAIRTKEFIRVRVGITPTGEDGKIKKPKGEPAVIKFVLGKFRESEMQTLEKVSAEIVRAIPTLITEGLDVAMNTYN